MALTNKKPGTSLAQSCSKFSSALHKTVACQNKGNIVDSPISAHILLTYLLYGCNGSTAEEIKACLGLSDTQDFHLKYKQFMEILEDIPKKESRLCISFPQLKRDMDEPVVIFANSIFLQDNVPVEKDFTTIGKDFFEFAVQNVDFVNDKVATAKLINSWVSEKTKNTIQNAIEPNSIKCDTKLVLVNTIYMKAQWTDQFRDATRDRVFHVNNMVSKNVPTMSQVGNFHCGKIPRWKARFLHKSYEHGDLDMIIILPDEIDGLEFVEQRFDLNVLTEAQKLSQYTCLQLPKFKIESEIDLKRVFTEMKMKSMFEPKGHFLKICPIPMSPPLRVDEILQKCCLEVDEEGTTAAGMTIVSLRGGGCPPKPTDFFVDRPFMVVIRHVSTNIPLFVSSVKDIGNKTEPPTKK